MPSKQTQRRNREEAKDRRQSAHQKAVNRRRDTRRKILVGTVIIRAADDDPVLQKRVQHLLQSGLVRPGDRELFGLSLLAIDQAASPIGQRRLFTVLPITPSPEPLMTHWHAVAVRHDRFTAMASRLRADMKRRNRLAAKLRSRAKQVVATERRRETRRKILIGALVIAAAEDDPALQARVQHLLDTTLTRAEDRELFDLLPPDRRSAASREGGGALSLTDSYRQVSLPNRSRDAFNPAARNETEAAGSRE